MRITILGSGSPHPNPHRSAPAVLVEDNGRKYLFDCGEGTTRQLQLAGAPLQEVTTILFTHLHGDHSLGYGQFLIGGWIAGRRSLRGFGPPGFNHLHDALVTDLYHEDIRYRLDLGRPPAGVLESVEIEELAEAGPAYVDERVSITWLPVPHSIAAVAFRVDSQAGGSVVISGDTSFHEPLGDFARGVDVLVHDAVLSPNVMYQESSPVPGDVSWGSLARHHTTAEEAARVADRAGARSLVLTHFLPGTDTVAAVAACGPHYGGLVVAAEDLMSIDVPSLRVVT